MTLQDIITSVAVVAVSSAIWSSPVAAFLWRIFSSRHVRHRSGHNVAKDLCPTLLREVAPQPDDGALVAEPKPCPTPLEEDADNAALAGESKPSPIAEPKLCPTLLQESAPAKSDKAKKSQSSKTKPNKSKKKKDDDDMLAMEEQLRLNEEDEEKSQKMKGHSQMLKLFPALGKVETRIAGELEPLVVKLERAASKSVSQEKLKKDMLLVEEYVTEAMCTLDSCDDIGTNDTARAHRKLLMADLAALSKRAHVAAGIEISSN